MAWQKAKIFLRRNFDPEVLAVRRLIHKIPRQRKAAGTYTALMEECDQVFVDRLKERPRALKRDYWKHHFALDSFRAFPEIKGRILDFGCGSGHLDYWLAVKGMTITGIDASPVAIAIANRVRQRANPIVAQRLEYIEADVCQTYTGPKRFDAVWSCEVFEHIAKPGGVLQGLRQYVRSGTYFLICVPLGRAFDNPGHVNHFYTEGELTDFLRPHLSVIRTETDLRNDILRALCQF
ncbi:MAG TPA: class I SAM-dependent methyltransferase [Kiritimatiellia bacterium]|jgi:2-polyprenyl-6-hydroxyphenyl methylase/3-demethylubiquinone-9 3-methyltransferase|nr:MAG: Ubiquinone biosynthesis O-methyltransferase [Verrucomicrobia bacterium ADurb.Bin018]HOU59562.1 class I SAM-dependent methyltransferase [Kiritimatiellia bacterium]